MYSTALVYLRSRDEHGSYHLKQVDSNDSTSPLSDPRSKSRVYFESSVGILDVSGSLNTQTLEADLELKIYGINLGVFQGMPDRSFKINLDMSLVKGTVELKLTEFDELRLAIDVNALHINEEGSGGFIRCQQSHIIQTIPTVRCEPWLSLGV